MTLACLLFALALAPGMYGGESGGITCIGICPWYVLSTRTRDKLQGVEGGVPIAMRAHSLGAPGSRVRHAIARLAVVFSVRKANVENIFETCLSVIEPTGMYCLPSLLAQPALCSPPSQLPPRALFPGPFSCACPAHGMPVRRPRMRATSCVVCVRRHKCVAS